MGRKPKEICPAHDSNFAGGKGAIARTRDRRFTLGQNSDLGLTVDEADLEP
jgi:hypothetical protein